MSLTTERQVRRWPSHPDGRDVVAVEEPLEIRVQGHPLAVTMRTPGHDIELTVVDIRGEKVRLGIKAPAHIAVHRKEVYEAIRRENEEASRLPEGEVGGLRPRLPAGTPIRTGAEGAGRLEAGWTTKSKQSA